MKRHEDEQRCDLPKHVAEVELVYKTKTSTSERPLINSSRDAFNVLHSTWDMDKIELQEQFRVILVDRKNACIAVSTVAMGGVTACLIDLKIVFAAALKARATGIILAHNHPSGTTIPSIQDRKLTERFEQAGKLLDLPILDHLIVTKDGYTSMSDEGLLFMP